jgi:hypothetical protein
MCLGLSALVTGSPVALKEFAFKNPLVVGDEAQDLFLEAVEGEESLQLEARSPLAVHLTCRGEREGPSESPPVVAAPRPKSRIVPESIYSEKALFHGPVFRTAHEAFLADDGGLFVVVEHARLLPVFSMAPYDRLVQWIDTAFQTVGLHALMRHGAMALPVGVKTVRVFDETGAGDRARVVPSNIERSGDTIRADVSVTNEAGEVLVRLERAALNIVRTGLSDPVSIETEDME